MIRSIFISHASEDKDSIARPLAQELSKIGLVDVWYDEYSLRIGDSLRQSIDRGLDESDYGVVILSKNFFAKSWPREELDGLMTKQVSSEQKIILPIWHEITFDEVRKYSPMLAGKVALDTNSHTSENIAQKLVDTIFNSRPREDFIDVSLCNDFGGEFRITGSSNAADVDFNELGLDHEKRFSREKMKDLEDLVKKFIERETYLKEEIKDQHSDANEITPALIRIKGVGDT